MRSEMSVMVGSGMANWLKDVFPPGTVITAGDTKLIWDSDNKDEIDSARETFERLTKKGYSAFLVEGKGDKGERMKKFDPNAEKIILVPAMQGGVR